MNRGCCKFPFQNLANFAKKLDELTVVEKLDSRNDRKEIKCFFVVDICMFCPINFVKIIKN